MNLPPLLAFLPSLNKLLGAHGLASEHGEMVDHMLELVHWFMLLLFVGWSVFMGWVLVKYYHKRHPKADYVGVQGHASTHIEIGVVIVEVILLLGFAFPLWATQSEKYPSGPNVLKMRAVGEKFAWNFQYAGQDGVLGRTSMKLVDTSGNPPNVIGRDLKDPNGKDDFVKGGVMTIPVDRPVIVDVTSKDVIHAFAVAPMRVAQDATPGIRAHMWFRPTKVGSYDIICGQLCGPGHSGMRATLQVVPQPEFDEFMKEGSEGALKAAGSTDAPAQGNTVQGSPAGGGASSGSPPGAAPQSSERAPAKPAVDPAHAVPAPTPGLQQQPPSR